MAEDKTSKTDARTPAKHGAGSASADFSGEDEAALKARLRALLERALG